MSNIYRLHDPSDVASPALLFYRDIIKRNIGRAIEIAGGVERLRPHVKTHKTREIARLWLAAGVTKHKCATIAEAEMLAACDAPEVLIAYPLVGPNPARLAKLAAKFPRTRFGATVDHPDSLQALSQAMTGSGQAVDVYIDINCGMNRTGIAAGDEAFELYRQMNAAGGLTVRGFHAYDGHNNQEKVGERQQAVSDVLGPVLALRERCERAGLPVDRVIVGGTPTFAVHAGATFPGLECSPGTLSLHDANYGSRYPELGITPAAVLLTRVVSRPSADRLTLDLGSKAVSPDQPPGKRCVVLDMPEHEAVMQSEEHLVIRTPEAARFRPGDVLYALPAHVCPTVALHRQALVVDRGRIVDRWDIIARDRELTV